MTNFIKKQFERLKDFPCILLFLGIIFSMMLLDLIYPDREISELENTKLAQKPAFSVESLLKNKWTADYAEYLKDQIPLRDGFIGMQNRCESLLFHKNELSNILIGKDAQLFTKQFVLTSNEKRQLPKNIAAVQEFAARHPGQVTFMLAPSASVIYPEKLPANAPMLDEGAYLDDIFAKIAETAQVVDIRDCLTAAKDEYIYYRNDHHWTTLGAYKAYEEFCKQKGFVPFDISAHTAIEVKGFYGTHYGASRYYGAFGDTLTYYELPNQQTLYTLKGETFTAEKTADLYDYDALDTHDMYAAFLHGNGGYSVIEGSGKGSVLVIKDSYANCFVPFLTENYSKIGVVDLRNLSYSIDKLMKDDSYDEVLILYNFASFKSDTKLAYLNYQVS